MDKRPVKVRIIIYDKYLVTKHKLYRLSHHMATPNYTSTKKLKGYIVKSKTEGTDIYMKIHEVEILNPQQ